MSGRHVEQVGRASICKRGPVSKVYPNNVKGRAGAPPRPSSYLPVRCSNEELSELFPIVRLTGRHNTSCVVPNILYHSIALRVERI